MPEILEQENIHQTLHQVNEALDNGMFVYVRKLLQGITA
jgi:magnesium transporter